MTTGKADIAPDETPAGTSGARYDGVTIALHWLTAILVVALFGSSYWWNSLPGGTPLRKWLQAFHVSLGIMLAAAFLARLLWRLTTGQRLVAAEPGALGFLARSVHLLLYVLLAAQVLLGFALRWAQGEEFFFFGTFSIPEVLGPSKSWENIFEPLHNDNAWVIVIVAGGHAIAALVHHYLLRDRVMRRMLPVD